MGVTVKLGFKDSVGEGIGRARCYLHYVSCCCLPPGAFLPLCSASLPLFVVPVPYAPPSCTLAVGWAPGGTSHPTHLYM